MNHRVDLKLIREYASKNRVKKFQDPLAAFAAKLALPAEEDEDELGMTPPPDELVTKPAQDPDYDKIDFPKDEEGKFLCPFAFKRRGLDICTHKSKKSRASIRSHLRGIRMVRSQPRGGDVNHPIGHWLWSSPAVKWYVHGQAVKTPEQRAKRRRLLKKQNYQQRKAEYDKLNAIVNADLNAGRISKADALEKLAPVAVGYYRKCLQLQQNILKAEESVDKGLAETARAELDANQQKIHQFADWFNDMMEMLAAIFLPDDAIPMQFPSTSSIQAFCIFIHLLVKKEILDRVDFHKPTSGPVKGVLKSCTVAIHPDQKTMYDEFMTKEVKEKTAAVLNASMNLYAEEAPEWDDVEWKEFDNEWRAAETKVQEMFMPKLLGMPPIMFKFMLDKAQENCDMDKIQEEDDI